MQVGRLRELADELHARPTRGRRRRCWRWASSTELLEQRRAAERADFAERFAAYDTKRTSRALDDLLAPLRSKR